MTPESKIKKYLRDAAGAWSTVGKTTLYMHGVSDDANLRFLQLTPNPISQMGGVAGRPDYSAVAMYKFLGKMHRCPMEIEVKPDGKYLSKSQVQYITLHANLQYMCVVRGKEGIDAFLQDIIGFTPDHGASFYGIKPHRDIPDRLVREVK